jgi:hypothetical protein
VYNKTNKKLTKKSKPIVVDLSNDGPFSVVSLSKFLTDYWKTKAKNTWKILNKEDQLDTRWIKQELPYWQELWLERGIKIRWDRRQRSFFLTAVK